MAQTNPRKQQQGVVLLETMVAILIFSVGVLAIVGMQSIAVKNVTESKYRTEAAFLANELLAQLWRDTANIDDYEWDGTGAAPAALAAWKAKVDARLPNTTAVPPLVTLADVNTGAGSKGANVDIQIRWRMPDDQALGVATRNYRMLASVYGNP